MYEYKALTLKVKECEGALNNLEIYAKVTKRQMAQAICRFFKKEMEISY